MDSLTSGTIAGAGSFRCRRCGYTLTLDGTDRLTDCPGCGGSDFVRASLFAAGRLASGGEGTTVGSVLVADAPANWDDLLTQARDAIEQPGDYLCYEESGEVHTVALTREWTRIGRSLVADVRFDDPTVSRRHALIVRQADGVRLLDDRSLNGVFVNGARVEGRTLKDGDEIIVGRYRLAFMSVASEADAAVQDGAGRDSVQAVG
jgi:DNA-directed RNA polymerase subunit RPC12/RpoP